MGKLDRNPGGTEVIPFFDRYKFTKLGRFVKTPKGIAVNRLAARFLRGK